MQALQEYLQNTFNRTVRSTAVNTTCHQQSETLTASKASFGNLQKSRSACSSPSMASKLKPLTPFIRDQLNCQKRTQSSSPTREGLLGRQANLTGSAAASAACPKRTCDALSKSIDRSSSKMEAILKSSMTVPEEPPTRTPKKTENLQRDLEELGKELRSLELMCHEIQMKRSVTWQPHGNQDNHRGPALGTGMESRPNFVSSKAWTASCERGADMTNFKLQPPQPGSAARTRDTAEVDRFARNRGLADAPSVQRSATGPATQPCSPGGREVDHQLLLQHNAARSAPLSLPVTRFQSPAPEHAQQVYYCTTTTDSSMLSDVYSESLDLSAQNSEAVSDSSSTSAYNTGSSNSSPVLARDIATQGKPCGRTGVEGPSSTRLPHEPWRGGAVTQRNETKRQKHTAKATSSHSKSQKGDQTEQHCKELGCEGWRRETRLDAKYREASDAKHKDLRDTEALKHFVNRLDELMYYAGRTGEDETEIRQKMFVAEMIRGQLERRSRKHRSKMHKTSKRYEEQEQHQLSINVEDKTGFKTVSSTTEEKRVVQKEMDELSLRSAGDGSSVTTVKSGGGGDETVGKEPQQDGSVNARMEWVIKVRRDGSHYILRRPVRNRLLRERAKKLAAVRGLTTDDDNVSEWKLGRHWTRSERKQHLERAKSRRRQRDWILRARADLARFQAREPIVRLCQKKRLRHKGRQALDNFTTLEELLAHGCRLNGSDTTLNEDGQDKLCEEGGRKKSAQSKKAHRCVLLSVTTV